MRSTTFWFELAIAVCLVGGCDDDGTAGDEGDKAGTSSSTGGDDGGSSDSGDGSGESDGESGADSGGSDAPASDDGPGVVCEASEDQCGQDCTDLTSDIDNCGSCGVACVIPNGAAVCDAGACGLAVCESGWADCDGTVTNGCEQPNTCETDGACATECGSTGSQNCDDPCAPTCIVPAELCNFEDDDCDGECDEGGVEGCRVGVHLANDPVYGQVLMTDEADAETYGVTIEQMNFFYLYVLPGGGSQPLQRCVNGPELGYSEENGCGMFGGYESTLGFFGTAELCGAIPLTRLLGPANNSTRMAIDQVDINTYLAQGWTVDPDFEAYAWPNP